jgi:hypothetical protein
LLETACHENKEGAITNRPFRFHAWKTKFEETKR